MWVKLRSLLRACITFVDKMRRRVKVRLREGESGEGTGEQRSVGGLLERCPPGRARYHRRFGVYAKRARVRLPWVGEVGVVLVWVGQGTGWRSYALVSTLVGEVQDVLEAWFCHPSAEGVHRMVKQNLGQGKSRARSYAAQLMHNDLVVGVFLLVRAVWVAHPGMPWRKEERVAGKALLTELKATSPPEKRLRKGGERWGENFCLLGPSGGARF
ncbi:hypothetical protein TJA_20240 [Thermus sp. LT1-2-5]|uniref:hypothetical protein n=1 Tax=Thermus sp. LT1-2-5 TaxID=3026935 RepID=UPI0030E76A3E